MLGTYALSSAGYYDAYGKALKVRTLIRRDFDAATSASTSCCRPRRRPRPSVRRQDRGPDGHVPQRRSARSRPTWPVIRPCRSRSGGRRRHAGRRVQVLAPALGRSSCSAPPRCSRERPDEPRPRRWEIVDRLEVHTELLDPDQVVLGAVNRFGGEPNTHIDPMTLVLPGAAGAPEQAVESHPVGLAQLQGQALGVRPQETTRPAEELPDLPVRAADQRRRLAGAAVGKRVGIERAHLEEDTGKSTHRRRRRAYPRRPLLAGRPQPRRRPLLEIVGRPDRAPRTRPRRTCRSCVRSCRRRASDGKMEWRARYGSTATCRSDTAATVTSGTRCEIKNINSLRAMGRAIDYEAAWQADRSPRARRWSSRPATGTTPRVAPPLRPRRTRTTALSTPTWSRSTRGRSGSSGCAALLMLLSARRHRLAERTGGRPRADCARSSGLDELCLTAVDAGADPERVSPTPSTTWPI